METDVTKIKAALLGNWECIAPEIRPSKGPDGSLKPFYLKRAFKYLPSDRFELDVVNSADPYGAVPLAKIRIVGHMSWHGPHPIAPGAQKVDFVADEAYEVTPLAQGFVDILNKVAAAGYAPWALNSSQSIFGKTFLPFGLKEGTNFMEYDLAWISMERHWANGKRSVSKAAESLALPNRYVVWCADRSFCRFHLAYGSDEQNLRRQTLLYENFLCHRAFCDSDESWLQPFVVHLARKLSSSAAVSGRVRTRFEGEFTGSREIDQCLSWSATAQRLDATVRSAVAKSITDAVHDVIGSDLNLISVVLHELQQDQIWLAGQPSADVLILCYIRAGRPVHLKTELALRVSAAWHKAVGTLTGQVESLTRGISANAAVSTQGLPSVEAVYTWVRLAQPSRSNQDR